VTVDSGALHRAEVLLDLKRPQEAGEVASRAAAANPSDPQAWIVLARCYELTDEPTRALEMANRAIGLDPNDHDPHLIASRVLAQMGNHPLAVQAGHAAVRLAPMSTSAHANLAIALSGLSTRPPAFSYFLPRHLKLAAHHAQQAIALAPNSTAGHFAAGYVADKSNHGREARKHYRTVLVIDPQNAATLNNVAKLDFGVSRFSRGGEGFARALASDPSLKIARKNVRATLHAMAFAFHALGWLIYVSFSGDTSNPESGPLVFRWDTRGQVTVALGAAYAALAVAAYFRMTPDIRAFARRMVSQSWIIKTVLVSDAFMVVCFLVSNLGHGHATGTWFLFGLLGIPVGYAGFVLRRTRH
jgi:tetratricopeptide (TPR) repeat protein